MLREREREKFLLWKHKGREKFLQRKGGILALE